MGGHPGNSAQGGWNQLNQLNQLNQQNQQYQQYQQHQQYQLNQLNPLNQQYQLNQLKLLQHPNTTPNTPLVWRNRYICTMYTCYCVEQFLWGKREHIHTNTYTHDTNLGLCHKQSTGRRLHRLLTILHILQENEQKNHQNFLVKCNHTTKLSIAYELRNQCLPPPLYSVYIHVNIHTLLHQSFV